MTMVVAARLLNRNRMKGETHSEYQLKRLGNERTSEVIKEGRSDSLKYEALENYVASHDCFYIHTQQNSQVLSDLNVVTV
jgi:hypothetical protein